MYCSVSGCIDFLQRRPCKKKRGQLKNALKLMQEESGKHFEPDVIKTCESALPKILEVYKSTQTCLV
ncbi:MAG: hypothetical protein OQK75_12540 [Gammaproteobacteria bacterium]|nr:hypothetical protein [Gammaproteobacteria bacterium]MCW8988486.1 hypothetical protein [Gammaproteobacteria bacterium]